MPTITIYCATMMVVTAAWVKPLFVTVLIHMSANAILQKKGTVYLSLVGI